MEEVPYLVGHPGNEEFYFILFLFFIQKSGNINILV